MEMEVRKEEGALRREVIKAKKYILRGKWELGSEEHLKRDRLMVCKDISELGKKDEDKMAMILTNSRYLMGNGERI